MGGGGQAIFAIECTREAPKAGAFRGGVAGPGEEGRLVRRAPPPPPTPKASLLPLVPRLSHIIAPSPSQCGCACPALCGCPPPSTGKAILRALSRRPSPRPPIRPLIFSLSPPIRPVPLRPCFPQPQCGDATVISAVTAPHAPSAHRKKTSFPHWYSFSCPSLLYRPVQRRDPPR